MPTDPQKSLRDHVLYLLRGGGAHLSFDKAVEGVPPHLRGPRCRRSLTPRGGSSNTSASPSGTSSSSPSTRATSRRTGPRGTGRMGMPRPTTRRGTGRWRRTGPTTQAMQALVADPATDLFAPIPHGSGQTVLREALLVADHAAYHLGQLVVIRRFLGCWPEEG